MELSIEETEAIKERCKHSSLGEFEQGVSVYHCPVCQKRYAIQDLAQWAYKRRRNLPNKKNLTIYLCSYGCTRVYDKVFSKK